MRSGLRGELRSELRGQGKADCTEDRKPPEDQPWLELCSRSSGDIHLRL
jgi:hypothetical protein